MGHLIREVGGGTPEVGRGWWENVAQVGHLREEMGGKCKNHVVLCYDCSFHW